MRTCIACLWRSCGRPAKRRVMSWPYWTICRVDRFRSRGRRLDQRQCVCGRLFCLSRAAIQPADDRPLARCRRPLRRPSFARPKQAHSPESIRLPFREPANSDDLDGETPNVARSPLMHMMAGIYGRYQSSLARQGGLDYDDLIWRATDLLEHRPDLVASLHALAVRAQR